MRLAYTASDRFEAEMIAAILKDAGIFPFLKFDDEGGVNPGMQFGRGIPIMVADEDHGLAVEILKEEAIL